MNTPDTECEGCKHNKKYPNEDVTHTCPSTPDTEEDKKLCKELRMVSNMINMGEKIQWARETTLMDKAAERIESLSSRDTYWKERVLAILEDVLDREYQKRNPPKKHNYLESFMWDIHKAFMKDITNEDNMK